MNPEITSKTKDDLLLYIEELKKEVADLRKLNQEDLLNFELINNQLKESQEFINILFNINPDSILITRSPDGIVLDASEGFTTMFGYNKEDIIGKNTLDIDLWEDPEEKEKLKSLLYENGYYLNYEAKFKKKDGTLLIGLISSKLHSYSNYSAVISVTRDITERKKVEDALKESEEKLKAIFESANIGVFVTDRDRNVILCNKFMTELLGYESDEFPNMNLWDLTYPDDRENLNKYYSKCLSGEIDKYRIEKRYVRKDGTIIWADISVSSIKNANGDVSYLIAIINDISKRKEFELSTHTLIKAIELSPAAFCIFDIEGIIKYVNPAFYERSGYSYDEAIGKHINLIAYGGTPEDYFAELWEIILSGKEWRGELQLHKKDGELLWEYLYISPIFDNNGNIISVVSVREDISERKKNEKELKEINEELVLSKKIIEESLFEQKSLVEQLSEANRKLEETIATKDKFFSIIAHDLRGPFSGFLCLSDLLATEAGDLTFNQIKEMAVSIHKSANSVYSLLDNLLKWSRTQNHSLPFFLEEINIKNIALKVKETHELMASNKNISIVVDIPDGTNIICDGNMIYTVMTNLVSNAIKFTKDGGKIEIGKSEIIENNKPYFLLFIKDNGVGISDESIPNIFKIDQKISTLGTKGEVGHGLGLILCKEFVEKHGGKIWVESQKGIGTTFYFTLPIQN